MNKTNPIPTQQAETQDTELWRAISGVVDSHCKGIQLPRGINGLIDDLAALLNTRRAAVAEPRGDASLWHEAASIVEACLNVHSTYSDAEREFASHLIEVFKTRDQHPDYKHRNAVRAYPTATTARNRDEAQDIIMSSEEALGQCYDAATRHDLASRITEALDAAAASPTPAESDLISLKVALEVVDARLKDVPGTVDLEADRNLFAAGYLAAAGSIKAALQRLSPSLTKGVEAQCADCLVWFDREGNHTCRQQVRRNQGHTKR